jgi:eukaryotic-like serine/threonine-protein kinase
MKIPVTGLNIPVRDLDPDSSLYLEEPLGGGAFGDVFKARGTTSGNLFAVKFPRLAFPGTDEMIAFLNEVRAAQEIQHPNVVRVLFVETEASEFPPYLVMEFVADGTLKSLLDAQRNSSTLISQELLQTLTADLVAGISAINSKMLHRDLKPDNILVDDGTLKIGDFGLSKIVDAATRSRTFKGVQHLLYAAPETWNSETNSIQIDMYAMGIIFFEIAALEYPYDLPPLGISDVNAIQSMHLFQVPKSLRQHRPDLPIEFHHVVSRLMEKPAQDRFANWSEVQEVLQKSWEASVSDVSSIPGNSVASLLELTEQLHQDRTAKRLQKEKDAQILAEKHQLDQYQQRQLMERIRAEIRKYNEHSSLGQIRELEGEIFILPYGNAPNGNSIHFTFFEVNPPLNLPSGQVRFAAMLYDSGYPRLNYLLSRSDEDDLYGSWVVCEARYNALVAAEKRLSPIEPFGFHDHTIHAIETSSRSMHVFEVEFTDEIEASLLKAISDSMTRT